MASGSSRSLNLKVLNDGMRVPAHRPIVELSGQRHAAWQLSAIDTHNHADRNVLVFTSPRRIVGLLPPDAKEEWLTFKEDLRFFHKQWNLHAVPTLKRAERLYRAGEILNGYEVVTVAHRFGAVPALVVGSAEGFRIALFSESEGHGHARKSYSSEEIRELLLSLDDYLSLLLPAYYEQIVNYLQAVFFAGGEHRTMPFCLRVRQIAKASVRGKLVT